MGFGRGFENRWEWDPRGALACASPWHSADPSGGGLVDEAPWIGGEIRGTQGLRGGVIASPGECQDADTPLGRVDDERDPEP